jgi:prepilin-type N-terminal cleavage/methylation domain-containing protein
MNIAAPNHAENRSGTAARSAAGAAAAGTASGSATPLPATAGKPSSLRASAPRSSLFPLPSSLRASALARPLAGFTLIEMLAAVLIMTIVVLLLFTAFHQGQRGWLHGQKRSEAYREGRQVISRIAEEVALAVVSTNITFTVTSDSITFVAPLSDSYTTPTNILTGIEQTDLCWIKYEFISGTPAGYIRRTVVKPRGDKIVAWKTAVYTGSSSDTTWQQPVTGSNVLACTFSSSVSGSGGMPKAVRIRVTTLDSTTLKQIAASGNSSLTNQNARLCESQVNLINSY